MTTELDVLKDIPGYKAILKSVLKAQMQMLMEQLSTQTGEESIVLTASVHDGSLSHLGSVTGKGFLAGRDELKAQFLGFCLNSEHKKESHENESQQYNRSRTLMPPARRQRPRIRPGPYSIPSPGSSSSLTSPSSFTVSGINQSGNVKDEMNDNIDNFDAERDNAYVNSNNSDHVTSAANENDLLDSSQSSNPDDHQDAAAEVKIERDDIGGDEGQVEENSISSSENWEHNGVTDQNQDAGTSQPASSLGGIAFPGLDNAHHDFSSKLLPEMSANELKQALYPQDIFKENVNVNSIKDLQKNHIGTQGHFDPAPRKRGRPPKLPSLPRASPQFLKSSPPSQISNENDVSMDNTTRKRGRPRKDCDEDLPPGVVRPMGISIGNGYVKCNICGKILKATSMFSHKQSHLGIRNYSCEFCGKSFTQKGPLITHKRVHTGEKPYSCPRCGKAFAAHSGLYQHSRRCDRHAMLDQFNLTM